MFRYLLQDSLCAVVYMDTCVASLISFLAIIFLCSLLKHLKHQIFYNISLYVHSSKYQSAVLSSMFQQLRIRFKEDLFCTMFIEIFSGNTSLSKGCMVWHAFVERLIMIISMSIACSIILYVRWLS